MRKESKKDKLWTQLNISQLEADIAYFEARLALLEAEPRSYYQTAQTHAYRELEMVLKAILDRLQRNKTMLNSSSSEDS